MISVVVVTYNSAGVIGTCLGSLLSQECREKPEVIVVDNGSSDGTVGLVRERFPGAVLLENGKNLGASAARNRGIAASRGEWVLIIDCDTEAGKGFLPAVERAAGAEEESKTGMIQPRILCSGGSRIFSCGITLDLFWRFKDIGRGEDGRKSGNCGGRIDAVCSACAGYRRRMLEDIKDEHGYFDERFFFMVEDVELGLRAGECGWKTVFCPGATVYHSGNSSGFSHRTRQYLCWRNRKLMLKKKKRNPLRLFVAFLFYDLPRDAVLFMLNLYVRRALFGGGDEIPACLPEGTPK